MKSRIYYFSILFWMLAFVLSAQSTDQNYIVTTMPNQPVSNPAALVDDWSSSANSNSIIQYFDGLERLSQTVQRAITPSGADLVTGIMYDSFGRDSLKWLPAVAGGNNGAYYPSFATQAQTSNGDAKPYSQTEYELSPLNRVTGQYGAGKDWYDANKKVNTAYQANDANEVIYFSVENDQLKRNGNYDPNTLYKTIVTDEDGKPSTEYKDKQGQVVMKRNSGSVDTYYVYNDLGQLSYVIPPKAVDELTDFSDDNVIMKQYCYLYKYDERGNCIYKKLPGCTPIYMVYDKADRMVLSQDGNQRKKLQNQSAQWTVTKYDALGRVVFTGLMYRSETDSTQNYKSIRDVILNDVVTESYAGFATATPLTINYYDSYSFIPAGNHLSYDNSQEQNGYTPQFSSAKGLLTGTRVYHLDDPTKCDTTALYYDKYGRVVQTRASNHLGGSDMVYNKLDFRGKVLNTRKEHNISGQAVIPEVYRYAYDKAERLLLTRYKLGANDTITLAANSYDELGRVSTNNRHNGTDPQSYVYNIRNWPTKITSGTFEENLYYNSNLPSGATANYNGNIAYSTWTYNGVNKGYAYVYDDLNRLTSANFKQESSSQGNDSFNESFTFDKMGNILTLQRKSNNTLVDDLTLHYANGEKSNQIDWITDAQGTQALNNTKEYQDISKATSGEFAYDVNGNMTKDLDRNIVAIQYNVLNLPDIIQFRNGNQIKNTYDASGHKLGTEYFTQLTNITPLADGQIISQSYIPGTVDQTGNAYIGTMEYKTQNGNSSLTAISRIYNDEGYVENPSSPQYYYFRHDHLGDNREVWLANTNTVAQRTQYYPSGLPWAYQTGDNPDLQHRKYNGKEFVEMHGYDTYDIVWRQYYPAIMRFQTPDPEAEKYYSISPYTMCEDNTVRNIDTDGRDGWDIIRGIGEAFLDDANPNPVSKPLSNSSNPKNQTHYSIGQTIGHVVAAVTGALETIEGGGTAGAGGLLAVAGSETVVAVPLGGAIAAVGAAEATHGTMMLAKAAGNLSKGSKNLVESAKKSQKNKEAASERQDKRQAQTERGKNRTGNSNQDVRGSHHNNKNGNKNFDKANARRAREQKKADEKNKNK